MMSGETELPMTGRVWATEVAKPKSRAAPREPRGRQAPRIMAARAM